MKRILICVATIVAASGAINASSIISCSGAANSSNSCDTSHLATFTSQLQWESLSSTPSSFSGIPYDGTAYNGTWYGTGSFMDINVTGTSLIRAEDYAKIWNGNSWVNPGNLGPYKFTGNFDSAPDTGSMGTPLGLAFGANGFGESLLGSYGGNNNAGAITLGMNNGSVLTSFGFRVASITMTTFNVTINLFSSTDGTGTSLQTLTLAGLSGGGNCGPLNSSTPQPCNTAPFIFVDTAGAAVHSFTISTSDNTGFYMDGVDFNSVPEPAPMLLTGGTLMMLAYLLRRKRSAAARR